MSRQNKARLAWLLIFVTLFTGCHPTQPFYAHNDRDLSHYIDVATDVEHPDLEHTSLAEVQNAGAPLTVSNPEFQEIWDLSLEEVVSIALQNSKVIRNAGAIQANFGFSDGLIGRVTGFSTQYDSALTETNTSGAPRGVNTNGMVATPGGGWDRSTSPAGVEDALSEFDAQFFSRLQYNKTDRPNNSATSTLFFQPSNFQQNDSDFIAGVSKKTASGAVFGLRNRTDFTWNNTPATSRAVPGDWISSMEVEWAQPWGRGRGTQINRIPIILARINTDISVADFEAAVRNLLMDIEGAYWDLHAAYRNLEASKIGRDSAQVTWKIVYEKWSKGVSPVQEEAQARGQYFQFRAQVETALRDLYSTETRVRWLMGLAASDGRLIRPKDEPSIARVEFDWNQIHSEALYRSTELRQQKWRIKQRELELISARNQLLPQINSSVIYRWLGRGDELINADRNGLDFPAPGSTAWDNLTGGQYQELTASVDFLPARFGARRELAAVRNSQLQLARTQAQLEEMELNLSHLLTGAIRDLDSNYLLAQTHFNRWVAAEKEVESVHALYEGGRQTLDLVLDAQRRRAQAQTDYYKALTDYNKSLAFVHYRKGSLLEHNGIAMAEGPWPDKAYWDALGHARERDSSYYLDYGWTRPRVISRGPVEQETGTIDPTGVVPTGISPQPAEETLPEVPMEQAPLSPTGPTTGTLRGKAGMAQREGASNIRPAAATSEFQWGELGMNQPVSVTPSTSEVRTAAHAESFGAGSSRKTKP